MSLALVLQLVGAVCVVAAVGVLFGVAFGVLVAGIVLFMAGLLREGDDVVR